MTREILDFHESYPPLQYYGIPSTELTGCPNEHTFSDIMILPSTVEVNQFQHNYYIAGVST